MRKIIITLPVFCLYLTGAQAQDQTFKVVSKLNGAHNNSMSDVQATGSIANLHWLLDPDGLVLERNLRGEDLNEQIERLMPSK
ncbi:hypothetical protein PBAL39_24590 [Pedobacter sp. BAL39]|nr:hypothetical protein PBAL39_24590 [Pedobacter sp. BAL39]